MNKTLARWIAANGPFQRAPLTFSGMLLCIFASVFGLIAASSDQTGYSAAAVTDEFRRDLGFPEGSEPSVSDHATSAILRFASFRRDEIQVDDGKRRRLAEEEEELFSLEDDDSESSRRARDFRDMELANGFRHFVREVDRLGAVSNVRQTESMPFLDVFISPTSPSERSEQLTLLIREVHQSVFGGQGVSPIEYRITLWSPTPSVELIGIATEQASVLEAAISRKLDNGGLSSVSVSVECACWMLPDSPRPAYSVQAIRRQDE